MPAGVLVVVENGFATIDFVDKAKRGPALAKLFEIGTPPDAIEKLTRSGPRAVYVVPEGNAREAGLLDEADVQDTIVGDDDDDVLQKAWPDGEPDDDWKRPQLDAYAAAHGIDTSKLSNKAEVLAAIQEAK
ncbi:hypothetical protein BTO20_06025 [Mycobacterium dioxanotrophicus]|jgi:hypothetical protein|uniref:Uncharacterized protein n=1 Tax=Mycobacterium dioxanotrophicus TaxID=482462 RepID=A0A1Y0BZ96_9MYCO|nr:hypothetical protein [Mycobacterium dioxanotrophicus]ART68197.1 hypothetical protein BTO20_06025 [Mycobacterium dioxanotrophicus]